VQAYAPPAQDEKAITLPDTLYRLSIPQQAETGRGLEPVLLAHRMAANELPALAREDAHAQRTFAKNPDQPLECRLRAGKQRWWRPIRAVAEFVERALFLAPGRVFFLIAYNL
jgi:hypothetical protein